MRFLAADEIEIDFENGRDFREADVLINEGSLANVVRRRFVIDDSVVT